MKNNVVQLIGLLVCLLSLGLAGCESNVPELKPIMRVGDFTDSEIVESADMDAIDALGGGGSLTFRLDGVKVSSSADWLTVSVSGRRAAVKAAPNPALEQRVAVLTLTAGDLTEQVPVSQSGVVDRVGIESSTFDWKGESISFPFRTQSEYDITIDVDWFSYETSDDKIIFTAEPMDPADPDRKAVVTVSLASGISKSYTMLQKSPDLIYDMVLGEYSMRFETWDGEGDYQEVDVTFERGKDDTQFILKGLGFDVVIGYVDDALSPGITIKGQVVTQDKWGDDVWLAPWQASGNGFLIMSAKYGLKSVWNGNKRDIVFKMIPDGQVWQNNDGDDVEPRGFILWGANGEYNTAYGRIVNPIFTKKPTE